MTTRLVEKNDEQLADILSGQMNLEKHIDNYERSAIYCGDLKRAIKYNWLRNAYIQGLINDDEAFLQLMVIHAD